MVQIVENWCCVTGVVLACVQPPHKDPQSAEVRQVMVEIKIDGVRGVEGFKNLLDKKSGDRLKVMFPQGLAETSSDLEGRTITLPVRVAPGDRYFAASDWTLKGGSERCGQNPSRD
jgi:hypothetical protein